jgi:hypothetical protein
MTSVRQAALAGCLVVGSSAAHAGEPLATDDASIVSPKTCQLEVWARALHDGREYWAQPACNFTGNVEFDVAGAREQPDGGDSSSLLQLQAKTVLFSSRDNVWSFGVVGGASRDTGAPHGRSAFQSYYAKALASWYPQDGLELDFNLGASNSYGPGTFALAGAAIQYAVVPGVELLAEAYRDEPGRGKYQVGVRWIVVADRFETYISYGDRLGGSPSQWAVIAGIRLQSPAFLP